MLMMMYSDGVQSSNGRIEIDGIWSSNIAYKKIKQHNKNIRLLKMQNIKYQLADFEYFDNLKGMCR